MAVNKVVNSIFDADDFADYEQEVYKKHIEKAEQEIIGKLDELLSDKVYLGNLKQWAAKCSCRFIGYRKIEIRLKSGQRHEISSPIFYRSKSKNKKKGRKKRQKQVTRHIGLEAIGIIDKISPALVEICISMAILCPSFEVAANALRGLGIAMNECLLQNVTHKFAGLAKQVRVECHDESVWQKSGIKILICVDGGRIRERTVKRGWH